MSFIFYLLPVELRRMIVNVLNDNIEESGCLLGWTAEVGHVQDQGVVGPVLAIQLNLITK